MADCFAHTPLDVPEHVDRLGPWFDDLFSQHRSVWARASAHIGGQLALGSRLGNQHAALLGNRNEALGLHDGPPCCRVVCEQCLHRKTMVFVPLSIKMGA